jgi:Skp family chaperone for outer membrane proteins
MQDYQTFMRDTFGDDGLIAQRNKELTQPIVDKINVILARIGEEEGFTVIFDAINANIIWARSDIDLTDRIIEELGVTGQ